MICKTPSYRQTIVLGIISVLVLLVLYTALSRWQHARNPQDRTIPTWKQFGEGIKRFSTPHPRSGERWVLVDGWATLHRLFFGFAIGTVIAVILGMSMGCLSVVDSLLNPPLTLLKSVPPTAIMAVFFVLVGTNLEMYIAVIGFGLVPILAKSVDLAVKDVPKELLFKSYTLGASHFEVASKVIFPTILPKIIDAIRLQVGPALVFLIAAELLCADEGFGYRIRLQSRLLQMDVVYPYLAILAGFGYAVDSLLRYMQCRLSPWYSSRD